MELVSYTLYHAWCCTLNNVHFLYTFTCIFQLEELDSQVGLEEAKMEGGDDVPLKDEEETEKSVFFEGTDTRFSPTVMY